MRNTIRLGKGFARLSRPVRILVGIVACIAIIPTAVYGIILLLSGDIPFNQHDWFEDADCVDGSNRRGHMARDIVSHHLKPGMTYAEIRELLGTPYVYSHKEMDAERHDRFNAAERKASTVLVYYLGEELFTTFAMDRAWLDLRMDAADHYTGYRFYTP